MGFGGMSCKIVRHLFVLSLLSCGRQTVIKRKYNTLLSLNENDILVSGRGNAFLTGILALVFRATRFQKKNSLDWRQFWSVVLPDLVPMSFNSLSNHFIGILLLIVQFSKVKPYGRLEKINHWILHAFHSTRFQTLLNIVWIYLMNLWVLISKNILLLLETSFAKRSSSNKWVSIGLAIGLDRSQFLKILPNIALFRIGKLTKDSIPKPGVKLSTLDLIDHFCGMKLPSTAT